MPGHYMNKLSQIAGILLLALYTFNWHRRKANLFPRSKLKSQTFTKVTVTSVTATDIYFSHAGGLASAKLKDLSPELQKHFNYNAAKGAEIENAQHQATANYRANLRLGQSPEPKPKPETPKAEVADEQRRLRGPQTSRAIHPRPIPSSVCD